MKTFDIFPNNLLEMNGEIKRTDFILAADQCTVWKSGFAVTAINGKFPIWGHINEHQEMEVRVDNGGLESYIDDYMSFGEISMLHDRIMWSNGLLDDNADYVYPNMSLFYVDGWSAIVRINRSDLGILIEFTSPLARDVEEADNEIRQAARMIESLEKDRTIDLDDTEFVSSCHQRYENGTAKGALQANAHRSVIIRRNPGESSGYLVEPGDGYIVKILNLDGVHPLWGDNVQLSPKAMRITSQSPDRTELRGFSCLVRGPFGYVSYEGEDFGMTVDTICGEIRRCVLHRYDRALDIAYFK